jgi:hypothetical protein
MSNKDSLMNQSKGLQIWFAEDIKYIVAKEYHNKRSILANIEGNCIWLEFSHVSSSGWSTVTNGPISDTFSTKVISIEPKELPDDVFELPANYSLSYKEPDIMSAVDEALEPIETPAKKTKGTKPVKG